MSYLLLFLLVCACVGGAVVAFRVMSARRLAERRQAAMDSPPARVCIQALLPPDATDSNQKMTRFWQRLCDLLPADEQALAQGTDTVSCALVGEGRGAGRAAHVRLLLWCPAEISGLVESTLQDAYEGELQINHLEEDPLTAWADQELSWRRSQSEPQETPGGDGGRRLSVSGGLLGSEE